VFQGMKHSDFVGVRALYSGGGRNQPLKWDSGLNLKQSWSREMKIGGVKNNWTLSKKDNRGVRSTFIQYEVNGKKEKKQF